MSGFPDDSPFSDPFADPSITQVTGRKEGDSGLEDYNPFANQPSTKAATGDEPAVLPTTNNRPPQQLQGNIGSNSNSNPSSNRSNQPPNYSQSGAQNVTQEDLQRRQEELEKKAAELAAREEALRNNPGNPKMPNWPPMPKICPLQPCIYQDINVEIPPEFQKLVRYAYYLWMYYVMVLLINMLGGLAMFIGEGKAATFGTSIVCMLFFTPLSFLCWFRPLYKAFRSDSSFNFMVFFFIFFCQFVLAVIWAIGIPSTGSSGLIPAIGSIGGGSIFVTIFLFITTIMLGSYAAVSFLVLVKVHSIYRSSGASFAKAQAEFAGEVMRNEHVQSAATAAATNVARETLAQARSGDNTPFRF